MLAFLVYRLLGRLSFRVLMLKIVIVVKWLGRVNCTTDSERGHFILLLDCLLSFKTCQRRASVLEGWGCFFLGNCTASS